MIKLVVGVSDIDGYQVWQARKNQQVTRDGRTYCVCRTRMMPKRADEIVRGGGSLYRVIQSKIVARQQIMGFEKLDDPDEPGRKFCQILLDPEIVETETMPHRPFQGWRYLEADKAPKDKLHYAGANDDDILPDHMIEALKDLSLL